MVSSDKKLANVVGGKSARACDNCVRKRAKWYCTADDAFLCQSCDSSVHSANPLARRHERVRLKTFDDQIPVPSWHKGFTRKARTPRKNKNAKYSTVTNVTTDVSTVLGIVPEISGEAENDEELLYRVPIFDPFVAEVCTSVNSNEAGPKPEYGEFTQEIGFLPSEMDLAEFAADVESLLGKGLDDESFDIEALGILDDERERERCLGRERVKVEEDEESGDHFIDGGYVGVGRETFELNFDYDNGEGDDRKELINMEPIFMGSFGDSNKVLDSKKILLNLNYDGVISAWDHHKSPWITGERPELNPNDCLSECAGTWGGVHAYGVMGVMAAVGGGDGGREARVSRYREKRRTRLFSKKIRYEVRKLNAEKRPRMKGRFVKRVASTAAFALINS